MRRRPANLRPRACGFTLIELLVVVAIIGLLVSILLPALHSARQNALGSRCLSQLHVLGQGVTLYANENYDVLPAGRLPKMPRPSDPAGDCNAYGVLGGRRKYRPTFLAMMSGSVGAPPFADPQSCASGTDMFGERGDRQNYSSGIYVCPSVPDWTDERNGAYGYNYQFLGNSRLGEDDNWKNWPVQSTQVKVPGRTVAVADCMGTVASFAAPLRQPYVNNARDDDRFGNEGFNLDPPRIDMTSGEAAGWPDVRTAADPRHRNRAGTLMLDGHADLLALAELGYHVNADGSIAPDGDNSRWSGNGRDVPWTPAFEFGGP